jgi:uncharacterized protein YcnI
VTRAALAMVAAFLVPAAAASAHVEVTPERAPAGSDAPLTFQAENERTNAATERLVIQMPRGVTSVKGLSLHGWKLTTQEQGGQVRQVTLAAPSGSELTDEQKGRFRLRVGLPNREGATLTFKVLQFYDDGDVVRWIGPEGTSEPAPQVKLTAARTPAPGQEASTGATGATGTTGAQAPGSDSSDGGDDDGGPPIWAGIGLIVVAALAGTWLARWRTRRRMRDLND